jgi:hypothetical protein
VTYVDNIRKMQARIDAALALHTRVPNHGRYSGEMRRECEEFCDHDSEFDGYVCATCHDWAGDCIGWPCDTFTALGGTS